MKSLDVSQTQGIFSKILVSGLDGRGVIREDDADTLPW